MHPAPDPLRPDDTDAYRQALRLLRGRSGLPIAFSGQVRDGMLTLSQFLGVRTTGLRGLKVKLGAGLGGKVLAAGRPANVTDYGSARSITHDYDGPVLAEGIRPVVAVPVVVSGDVRGVLYGACRDPSLLGNRTTDAFVDTARRLANELAIRDEVDRRMKLYHAAQGNAGTLGEPHAVEELRELHAELRLIAQTVEDETLRARMHDACRRLAGLSGGHDPRPFTRLTPRELDVLSQVALGCSNAEAARRLSLLPETVKAYLRSAMRKLDVHTRYEAVTSARRQGFLP